MKRETRVIRWFWALMAGLALTWAGGEARADDLIVSGTTVYLHGRVTGYDSVQVINGGRIVVDKYTGAGPSHSGQGNLEIVAPYIYVDATSSIDADGAGYRGRLCRDGEAPAGKPLVGGQGGCAVRDSGGGGGHFGGGGRGTKDISGPFVDPNSWEEDCGDALNGTSTACASVVSCWNNDGLPTVAGQPFFHSIWQVEFGASGGDKGCRDGDGFIYQAFSGGGGGRIVLAGIDPVGQTGQVVIAGTVRAMGWRGCGIQNDSSGGGAGGSILIVGDAVEITGSARIWANGGTGGDTRNLDGASTVLDPLFNLVPYDLYRGQQCGPNAQTGGTCDDCGGGGGGGIVSVLSRAAANINAGADFDVSGSIGGACVICRGGAGGGAGELQISGGWTGEICDGFDNDLDGLTDETADLGFITCGLGSCGAPAIPACENGAPNYCIPYDDPLCLEPDPGTRARFSLIVDTSGSMLTDLNGRYTFGDGSADHAGYPGTADSRLFLAKNALGNVIAAYPEIDWSLARYYQDQGIDRSCQLAKWFECEDVCCTYDSPAGNSGPLVCELDLGLGPQVPVYQFSAGGEQCINYAGSCGSTGNGAEILVGFGASLNQLMRWIDHQETNFVNETSVGDYCDFAGGGDCELRGTGPTPLADSLLTHRSYLDAVKVTDPYDVDSCRTYAVILLTDGAESCDGNP
ncbi:MAG TPA: hypothetical protein VM285_09925, partial [Polyangia bacterium]|nr:hypothetical protein [Polyangia bacterium]